MPTPVDGAHFSPLGTDSHTAFTGEEKTNLLLAYRSKDTVPKDLGALRREDTQNQGLVSRRISRLRQYRWTRRFQCEQTWNLLPFL